MKTYYHINRNAHSLVLGKQWMWKTAWHNSSNKNQRPGTPDKEKLNCRESQYWDQRLVRDLIQNPKIIFPIEEQCFIIIIFFKLPRFPKDIVNQNQTTKLELNQNQKATHNNEKARALEYGRVGNKAKLHHKLAVWPWGNVVPSLDLKSFNYGEGGGDPLSTALWKLMFTDWTARGWQSIVTK